MPKTKFQEFVFGVMMTFFMVLAMELYNTGMRMGVMTNTCFYPAISEMKIMFPICFVMGFFIIDRITPKITFKMAVPGRDNPLFVTIVRASVTVAFMCPIMSFWATLIFKKPGIEFVPVWLQTIVMNFPMAFFWQIFFCGPLVRWLFRHIFRTAKIERHVNSIGLS